MTPPRPPEVLFLDAGYTFLFPDLAAVATAAAEARVRVSADQLRAAQPAAKRAYEALLTQRSHHEDGWALFMTTLLAQAGAAGDLGAGVRAIRAAHDDLNLWRVVPPDVRSALERAQRAGLRMAVISNSEGRLRELLDYLHLTTLFEHVVDSGIEGCAKPDRRIFELALARSSVHPANGLYAGDIPGVDIVGPRAAGMEAVLIDAYDHYPTYVDAPRYRSLADLIDTLLPSGGHPAGRETPGI